MFKQDGSSYSIQNKLKLIPQQLKENPLTKADLFLRKAIKKSRNLTTVFHDLLIFIGEQGQKAAALGYELKKDEPFPPVFRRDIKNKIWTVVSSYDEGEEYNKRLLGVLQHHLKSMLHDNKNFSTKKLKVHEETCLGRQSFLDIQILPHEDLPIEMTRKNYERLCGLCSIVPDELFNVQDSFSSLLTNTEAMHRLKQTSPEDYKKIKLFSICNNLYFAHSSARISDWVIATVRMEINNKMYALTQYITWMDRENINKPIESMQDPAVVYLLLPDIMVSEEILKDAALHFKDAIEWDKKDKQVLINKLALMHYEIAHAAPAIYYTKMICQFFEMAIYAYHDLDIRYTSDASLTTEALISSLSEFVLTYQNLTSIVPIIARALCQFDTPDLENKKSELKKTDTAPHPLAALQKIYSMVYEDSPVVPIDQLKPDIERLKQAERNEAFWEILRKGFLGGLGVVFLRGLKNGYDIYDMLFPPTHPNAIKYREQNDAWFEKRLLLLDTNDRERKEENVRLGRKPAQENVTFYPGELEAMLVVKELFSLSKEEKENVHKTYGMLIPYDENFEEHIHDLVDTSYNAEYKKDLTRWDDIPKVVSSFPRMSFPRGVLFWHCMTELVESPPKLFHIQQRVNPVDPDSTSEPPRYASLRNKKA